MSNGVCRALRNEDLKENICVDWLVCGLDESILRTLMGSGLPKCVEKD